MNIEQLENRINELNNMANQHLTNLRACEGAMMECRFWINKLKEDEADSA